VAAGPARVRKAAGVARAAGLLRWTTVGEGDVRSADVGEGAGRG
jgi:hypothetical protein